MIVEEITNKEWLGVLHGELKNCTSNKTLIVDLKGWPRDEKPLPLGASHGDVWIAVVGRGEYLTALEHLESKGISIVKSDIAPVRSFLGDEEEFYIIIGL